MPQSGQEGVCGERKVIRASIPQGESFNQVDNENI